MSITTDLRRLVAGTVSGPGDADYDAARRPWNLAVPQPAAAVVHVEDAADVAAVVRYARHQGLAVAPQAAGHGASGDVEGTILLGTRRLASLDVDPGERIARVGAGVRWGSVLAAAAPHGLVGLAGSSPVVSVVGYTLGGGLSWFSRRHGLAANSVRAVEVVDAEGEPATVTAASDPELFWALRGGGGDFAVVTALEFDLHPAPVLVGGRMAWPADRAAAVLDAYRAVTAAAPDGLSVWLELLQFPGAPPMVAVDATHLGTEAEARRLLAPFERVGGTLSDGRAVMSPVDLGTITMEPTEPSAGLSRGELLTTLDDSVAEALLGRPIDPLLSVQVRHLGGALTRPADSAAGHIDEPFALYLFGVPTTPEVAAAVGARQDELVDALGPRVAGRKPQTFLAPTDHAGLAYPPATLARLRRLKADRDPAGVFRSNHPVHAARVPAA
jgi:FAD/FMN-containing dehydrogenase